MRDSLVELAQLSAQEPGNRIYQPYQEPGAPRVFRIFEMYDDEDAFKAHGESDHFKRLALGVAIPLLETREREYYEALEY